MDNSINRHCLNCLKIITVEKESNKLSITKIHSQEILIGTLKYIFGLKSSSNSNNDNNSNNISSAIEKFLHQLKCSQEPLLCHKCEFLLKQLIELRNLFKNSASPKSMIKVAAVSSENTNSSSSPKSRNKVTIDDYREKNNKSKAQTVASTAKIPSNNSSNNILQSIEGNYLMEKCIMEAICLTNNHVKTVDGITKYVSAKYPDVFNTCKEKDIVDKVVKNTKFFIPELNAHKTTNAPHNARQATNWRINPLVKKLHCTCCRNLSHKNKDNKQTQTISINETEKLHLSKNERIQCKRTKGDDAEKQLKSKRPKIKKETSSSPSYVNTAIKIEMISDSNLTINQHHVNQLVSKFESVSSEIMKTLSKVNSHKKHQFKLTTIESILNTSRNIYLQVQEFQFEFLASSSLLLPLSKQQQKEMTFTQDSKLRIPQIDVLAKYFNLLMKITDLIESNCNSKLRIAMEIIKLRLIRLIKFFTSYSKISKNGEGYLFEEAVNNVKIIDSYFTNICTCLGRKEFRNGVQNDGNESNDSGLILNDWCTMRALNIWDTLIKSKSLLNIDPIAIELDHNYVGLSGFQEKIEKLSCLCTV